MHFELTLYGHTVIFSLMALIGSITSIVVGYRYYLLNRKYPANVRDEPFTLKHRVKYAKSNVLQDTTPIFSFGLLTSLGMVLIAFSWTKMDGVAFVPAPKFTVDEIIELTPAIQPPPLSQVPPPPPPVFEIVVDEQIPDEVEPAFIDQMIQEATSPERTELIAPPMAPPAVETEIDEIVLVAEEMPRFPGCESMPVEERKACSEKRLLDFIYQNIRYPSLAQENGVEGTCVIRFVVGKDGTIHKTEILRDHGAGLGQEALRVVNLMNEMTEPWTPGRQNGRSVRVQFNLPITFKLR